MLLSITWSIRDIATHFFSLYDIFVVCSVYISLTCICAHTRRAWSFVFTSAMSYWCLDLGRLWRSFTNKTIKSLQSKLQSIIIDFYLATLVSDCVTHSGFCKGMVLCSCHSVFCPRPWSGRSAAEPLIVPFFQFWIVIILGHWPEQHKAMFQVIVKLAKVLKKISHTHCM